MNAIQNNQPLSGNLIKLGIVNTIFFVTLIWDFSLVTVLSLITIYQLIYGAIFLQLSKASEQ